MPRLVQLAVTRLFTMLSNCSTVTLFAMGSETTTGAQALPKTCTRRCVAGPVDTECIDLYPAAEDAVSRARTSDGSYCSMCGRRLPWEFSSMNGGRIK